ncbi:MAG: DNA polymerase III subunit delta [Lacibacter sp.]|jgi:DNA polymerase-3 subunit delta
MSVETILKSWKKKQFRPVYWLEGEEDYFIDQLMAYAEHEILSEAEAGFNLTVFYGKDAQWSDVVNACMRYPMFAERQVVLLKEAQHMKDIDKLEPYIENPLPTTVFVVAHKQKKLDGRSKLAKLLKTKAEVLTTAKIKEAELPGWTQQYIESKGYQPSYKAVQLITEHIGNDLSRITNEIDKLIINLGDRKTITEDDIENYIGISKEYNLFELQTAIAQRNMAKALTIVQYFEKNPKAANIHSILPVLYSFFARAWMLLDAHGDERVVQSKTGINPWTLKEAKLAASAYGRQGILAALLLLHEYNLRSVGVGNGDAEPEALLKEFILKLML